MLQPGEFFYAEGKGGNYVIVWKVVEVDGPAMIMDGTGHYTAGHGPWYEDDVDLHLLDDTERLRLRLEGKL